MRRILLPPVTYLAPPQISTLSHKQHDFRETKLLNTNMCFDFLYNLLSEILLILRIQRDIITNVKPSSGKVPVIPVGFELNLNFVDRFSEEAQISNFI